MSSIKKGMTYKDTGVDYEAMDPFKKACQLAAKETGQNMERFGFKEVEWSRGESVYLVEAADHYLAHVEEGLGTKNLVADMIYRLQIGPTYYDYIAQDTVAMIVNDMITLGAMPISVAMHLAVGDSDWFKNADKVQALVSGWRKACDLARCAWGGGETPTLKGIVEPGTALLSGSAIGIIKPKERLIRCNIQEGDAIVLLASSGIHANGLTLAREIAEKLTNELALARKLFPLAKPTINGYTAQIESGQFTSFAEALLEPTTIYVPVIDDCLNEGVEIHYTVNITGHGWRKLMRAPEPFVYFIADIPKPQPVFDFIQEYGNVSDEEAYGNLNMGAGFALYVPPKEANRVIAIAKRHGIKAMKAGEIQKRGDMKSVIIIPRGLEFQGDTLQVR